MESLHQQQIPTIRNTKVCPSGKKKMILDKKFIKVSVAQDETIFLQRGFTFAFVRQSEKLTILDHLNPSSRIKVI